MIRLYRLETVSHTGYAHCKATHTVLPLTAEAEADTIPEAERLAFERLSEKVVEHMRSIGPNAGLMDMPEMERAVLDLIRKSK